MRALSKRNDAPEKASRPYDRDRDGFVLGEGACIFVLEPETSPRPALAWITGFGFANDSDGQTAMGLADAIKFALANAMRRPDEVK